VSCAATSITSPSHPADRDAVVEVQRTRILIVDPFSLQASAREHQQLRIGGQLKSVERGGEEPVAPVVRKLQRPVAQLPVDVHDDVVKGRGAVLDGGIVERSFERAGVLRVNRRPRDGKRQRGDTERQ
jgi:hypothetical protein